MVDDLVKLLYLPTPLDESDEQGKELIRDIKRGWREEYKVLPSDSMKREVFEYLSKRDKCLVEWQYRGSYPLQFSFESPTDAKHTQKVYGGKSGNPIMMGVTYIENLGEYKF